MYERRKFKGSKLSTIIIFSLPLILNNILTQLYIIVDQIIARNFAGGRVVTAIGATGFLITLFTNIVAGVAVGAGAIVAQKIGKNDQQGITKSIHTAMGMSVFAGIIIGTFGLIFCKPFLQLLNTPESIIDLSATYMCVYFAGYIFLAISNFAVAILMATGDTKRPLVYASLAGIMKIVFSFIFVAIFKLGIAFIGLATVISFVVSCSLAVIKLLRKEEVFRLYIKKIRICFDELKEIIKMGVPIGMQTTVMSISNVLIQSSINSFGEIPMEGTTAALQMNNLVYAILTTMSQTSTIFCSKDYGAKDYKGLLKSLFLCLGLVIVMATVVCSILLIVQEQFLMLFIARKQALPYANQIVGVIILPYVTCGLMEAVSGGLRAINKSSLAMISSVTCLCGFRVLWIYTYFASHRGLDVLFYSYPISWSLALVANAIMFTIFFKKAKRTMEKEQQ